MPWDVPVTHFVGRGYRLYILRWGKKLKVFLKYGLSDGLWIASSTVETIEDIETILKLNGVTK